MDILTYQQEAERTNSGLYNLPTISTQIVHAAIGIATEAGEFLDPIKKHIFYGKPVDLVNMDEEVGDLLWYIAIYANARHTTIEALAARNNAKLRHRYPEKFTKEAAETRDLLGERKILEG